MNLSRSPRERIPALVLLAGAVYFGVGVLWWRSGQPNAVGSNDTYTYVYPTFAYALRSLREGSGLLWNPFQDCGQPFFAISQTALLYPINWIAALLDREPALIFTIVANLTIAGFGVYRLGREIGLSITAALSGALAFQLGGSALDMTAWSPVHSAPYAWMAMAMWLVERLVKFPRLSTAAGLAGALAMQLLPGFPQLVFFTYQLIALRVAWAVVFAQTPDRVRLVAMAAVGMVLPLGLTAVQLLPSLEVARESLRSIPLSDDELGGFHFNWAGIRALGSIDWMSLALGSIALLACRSIARATVVFYALVAALYYALVWGPGTPLFDIYRLMPMAAAFRGSPRFLWVVGFALGVLSGCGVQALLDLRSRGVARAWIVIVPLVAAALLLHAVIPYGLDAMEWVLVAGLIGVACASAVGWSGLHLVLPALMVFHGVAVVPKPFNGLRAGDVYGGNRDTFQLVRARLTAQDRVMIVGRAGDYALMPKSGMLFAVPDVFDYEPLVSRSYAEFFTYMRTGRPMQRLDDWYWIFRRLLPDTVQPRLLNMMATRYLLVDASAEPLPPALMQNLRPLAAPGTVRVFENSAALPRAYYVPQITVRPDDEILPALRDGSLDPRRVAAVSAAPTSGFTGSSADASGSVEITENAAERLVLRVHAEAPGFLYLADQYFPGWRAHVNGVAGEILRANYTFRAVEVPAGESEVVFTYNARVIWIGAAVTIVTLAVLVLGLVQARRHGF